jgi:hypothetical protein
MFAFPAIGMSEVFELKSHPFQSFFFCFGDRHRLFFKQIAKNTMILPKRIIDVPEKIIRHSLQFIIKTVPAIVIAEFFIYSSANGSLALPAIAMVQAHVLTDHKINFGYPNLDQPMISSNGIKRNLSVYLPDIAGVFVHICRVNTHRVWN